MQKHVRFSGMRDSILAILLATAVVMLCGCSPGPAPVSDSVELGGQRIFDLKEITLQQGHAYLSELGFDEISVVPGRNAIAVRGSPSDLYRAGVLMDLVDTRDEFLIETLAPAAKAGTVPANSRTAAALGDIAIGTFANPPLRGERTRAIIDIHGPSVVAIIPARIQRDLLAFVEFGSRQTAEPSKVAESPKATGADSARRAGLSAAGSRGQQRPHECPFVADRVRHAGCNRQSRDSGNGRVG